MSFLCLNIFNIYKTRNDVVYSKVLSYYNKNDVSLFVFFLKWTFNFFIFKMRLAIIRVINHLIT